MLLNVIILNEPFFNLKCFVPIPASCLSPLICFIERRLPWLFRNFTLVIPNREDFPSYIYRHPRMIVLDIDGHKKIQRDNMAWSRARCQNKPPRRLQPWTHPARDRPQPSSPWACAGHICKHKTIKRAAV